MNSPERQFNALTPDQEKKGASNAPETIIESTPIAETETGVAYLGVSLEKSESGDGRFVPKREQYKDFINDKEVALPMQRDIAVAFLSGEPLLIDGGTSLGKTTTVKKMAAELGWEIHYANLNGATDVEDLMGRYIPNPHKNKPEDPEYIFADGKVTSGLRQEDGKVKIVILDEFNASAPNILIRLHEVLDSLERGGDVILSEDASEAVSVNKEKTKIIALMNPPGKGYFGREPLDPAQLRRWVYKKLPTELPEGTFSYSTDALFGAEPASQNVTPDMFLKAREETLTPEQLQEVPGMREVLEKYKEFHKAAKELLKNRKVAEDQPQPFTFDDRMEPRRVRDFVLRFYTGDINETFQQALRYYYSNKLESEADRKKLGELIRLVEYEPKVAESKRKGTERKKTKESSGETSLEKAREIMGENFLGPEAVKNVFGVELDVPIQFSEEDLERAKELNQMLYLQVDKMKDKEGEFVPINLKNLKSKFSEAHDGGKIWYNQDWYNDEDFFKKETPKAGWKLVSKEIIPESTSKNYLEQTEIIVQYLKEEVFKGKKIPDIYHEAIYEFESKKADIAKMIDSDWQKAADKLEKLQITQLTRENPVEVMYRLILQDKENKEKLLPSKYTWTLRRDSIGAFVDVGSFDSDGAAVIRDTPDFRFDSLGVSFSRSL